MALSFNAFVIKPFRFVLATLIGLSLLRNVPNDGTRWSSLGPNGGNILSIAIVPTTPTTLYVGTNGAGLFKSMDGGDSWTAVNQGLTTYFIDAIAIDPLAPETVLVGTDQGIFRSLDGGLNWSATNFIYFVYTLEFDPVTPTIVYAGADLGMLKSGDGGATWSGINNGLPPDDSDPSHPVTIEALAINAQTPSILYAGSHKGVFKSVNSGASWNAVGPSNLHVPTLAIDPGNNNTLYAGVSGGGLFKTTTGGASWTLLSGPDSFLYLKDLVIDPLDPLTLYVIPDGEPKLYKTINGGGTWAASDNGIPKVSTHNIATFWTTRIAIDPDNSNNVYLGSFVSGGGRFDIGMYKSSNGGDYWEPINIGLNNVSIKALAVDPETPSTLYAGTYCAVLKSLNGGANWNIVFGNILGDSGCDSQILRIDPNNPFTIYWVRSSLLGAVPGDPPDGLFKSQDGGRTWRMLNSKSFQELILDPLNSSILYAITRNNGVEKSLDGGLTFNPLGTSLIPGMDIVTRLAINPIYPSILYAVAFKDEGPNGRGETYRGEVFKSTTGGTGWNLTYTSSVVVDYMPGMGTSLAIDPVDPQKVYAGLAGELIKTINGGNSWFSIASDFINTYHSVPGFNSLVVDPITPTTVYAISGDVFKTSDGGVTWNPFATGLAGYSNVNGGVNELILSPNNHNLLYLATENGGVFTNQIVLSHLQPAIGLITGGSTVTIKGKGFLDGATVTIGGTPAGDVVYVDSETLTATTPPCSSPGAMDVVVTNPTPDDRTGTLSNGFICAGSIYNLYFPFTQY